MHKQSKPLWKLIMMAALGFSLAVGGETLTLQPVQACIRSAMVINLMNHLVSA